MQGHGDDEPTSGEAFDAGGKPGGKLEESSDRDALELELARAGQAGLQGWARPCVDWKIGRLGPDATYRHGLYALAIQDGVSCLL